MVLALLVICFAVAPSSQKFTLHVDEVYPNFGPTVEILELSSGFMDTAELDVSTLRVQSSEGVTITTPGGITLDGASFSSTAGSVTISTTSSTSEINIIGANALDFFGNTVDFSSSNGNIDLHAEADMQFVGLGIFDAEVDNFNSIGDNIAVSAAAGSISFSLDDDFDASGGLFSADGINGLSVLASQTLTLQSVFNNLDVNGNTVALSGNTLAVNADRNNIVLAASSTLSGSFDDIAMNGPDGIYIVSMESSFSSTGDDVTLTATDGDFTSTALFEAYFAGTDGFFTSTSAGTRFLAASGMLAKLSDEITFTATEDLTLTAVENFSAHSSVGNVDTQATGTLTFAGEEAFYGSLGTSSYVSSDELSINGIAGMYITAEQSIVYGSQLPASVLFPIDVTGEDVRFGGATVAATVDSLNLTGTSDDLVLFRTSDVSRDSSIQMVADGNFDVSANEDVDIHGGSVSVLAARDITSSVDSMTFVTGPRAFGSQFSITATDFDIDSDDDFRIESDKDMLFTITNLAEFTGSDSIAIRADRNLLMRASGAFEQESDSLTMTAEDQARFFSATANVVFDAGDDIHFDSDGIIVLRSDDIIDVDADDIDISSSIANFHGTSVQFDIGADMDLTSDDGVIAFAGDNDLEVDTFTASGAFMSIGSPAGQDITFEGATVNISFDDDVDIAGNIIDITVDDFDVQADNILFASGDQKPILISADDIVSSSTTMTVLSSDDVTFDTQTLVMTVDAVSMTAVHDVKTTVDSTYTFTMANDIDLVALDVAFNTDGTHTTTSTGTSDYSAETIAIESSSGNIAATVAGTFTFDSSLSGFDPTAVSMTATGDVSLLATLAASANGNADWLQFGDLVEITSGLDTLFDAVGQITFLGNDIDHISSTLTSTSAGDMNVFGRDVEMESLTTMDFLITGDILIDGTSVTLSHTGGAGTVTTTVGTDAEFLSNGILNLFSGGDFYLSSALATNPPTERSIIITTSARSAGISVASVNANLEADGSIVFRTTDYATGHPGTSGGVGTNSGGFDINLLAEDVAFYGSDFVNAPTSGVRMLSEGAAYDKKLAINTGALFRSLSTGNIQVTSVSRAINFVGHDSVTFEAELGSASIIASNGVNTISTGLGDIVYENLGGDITFSTVTSGSGTITAGGYGTIQSGAPGQTVDANDSLTLTVGGDFDLQADRGRITLSQTGQAPMGISAFNILVEGADDFSWNLDGSFQALTAGVATNCEGGNTVSADCNDITIFGDTGASFTVGSAANSLDLTAGTTVLIESSQNNDVTFDVDNSQISATGAATITGGHNAEFNGGDMAVNALDIVFTTQGSHWINADGDVDFTSVADQRYEADHSLIVESLGDVTVDGPAIARIYAGGLGRPYGIEVNANGDVEIQSDQDISVASESFRALSFEDTTVTAGNSMTIHSLGTPNLGNDIFFESAEDIAIDADTQFLLTASNILMEFDTQLEFEGDIFMSSQRAITWTSERTTSFDGDVDISADDVSFVSFLRDPVDSVTGDSTSATGNTHAQEWSATGDVTMQSADDMTWQAGGVVSVGAGGSLDFFTANSNSDISFETLGKLSDIQITAGGAFDSASTRVDFVAVHSATFGSPSTVDIDIGDSATSTSEGDTVFSTGFTANVAADGDVEMTSTGRMITSTAGEGTDTFFGTETILIDADKDVVFELPHRLSSSHSSQNLAFSFTDEVEMNFGADFRFSTGGDTELEAEVVDISVNGVFQDNNDGLSAGDQTFGFRMTAVDFDPASGAAVGSVIISGNDDLDLLADVDINSDAANSFLNSVLIHVEAHGPDGITVSTSETNTNVFMESNDEIVIIADDFVNFVAFGAETGIGHIVLESNDVISPAALGYDFVQQPAVGLAVVSDEGDVSFTAQQGGISHAIFNNFNQGLNGGGQNNTASYYMNPGVNGTLTLASYGSDENGLGFSASAAGTYLVSEHNIVLEGQNVRFEELGQDPYYAAAVYAYANQNQDFYDLQQSRTVVYGYSEQDWTAAGANENGNGIEFVSSVPFKGITMQSYFVGLSAGGSIRMEAAEELSIVTGRQFIAESESSIIIEAHASSDEEIGILIASVDEDQNVSVGAGHVQFHAEEDLLLDAAGRLLLDADDMSISTGPQADVSFSPDSGFFVDTASTNLVIGGSMTFRAAQDIVFTSDNGILLSATTGIIITGTNADESNSDVIFGNPDLDSGTLSVYGGVDDLTGNVLFDTNSLVINAAVFDIAQTAGLILPEDLAFTSCASKLPGSTFIRYVGTQARLCYCNSANGDFVEWIFNEII